MSELVVRELRLRAYDQVARPARPRTVRDEPAAIEDARRAATRGRVERQPLASSRRRPRSACIDV